MAQGLIAASAENPELIAPPSNTSKPCSPN